MKQKLLIVVNVDWFFVSHRLPVAIAAMEQGYDVHVATSVTGSGEIITSKGISVHELPLERGSSNVFKSIQYLYRTYRVMRKVRPDIIHLITIKPVLFGGIAARLAGRQGVVAAISGLGFVFNGDTLAAKMRRSMVAVLYKMALKHNNLKVIFQNDHDKQVLMRIAEIPEQVAEMIPGSGVDLEEYENMPLPEGNPVVVMASRLLRNKGVKEFFEAARLLKKKGLDVTFQLAGEIDSDNASASVSMAELQQYNSEGDVELLGNRKDISNVFSKAHIIVLPSYYGEGLPKVLIEAAACGRAVVTTDHPGCRDAIIPGKSGLLVPVKNGQKLSEAILKLIKDRDLCIHMGKEGRKLAERKYDVTQVAQRHLEIYKDVGGQV